MEGESARHYRLKCARQIQHYSDDFKTIDLDRLPPDAFELADKRIRADAVRVGNDARLMQQYEGGNRLREIRRLDRAGRVISEFVGPVHEAFEPFFVAKREGCAIQHPARSVSYVPAQYLGLARDLRRRLASADAAIQPAMRRLLMPIQRRLERHPVVRKETLIDAAREWRALPAFGRVYCLVDTSDRRAPVFADLRIEPAEYRGLGWDRSKPGLAVSLIEASVANTAMALCRTTITVVSLHCLARRFQRAMPGRGDEALILDEIGHLALGLPRWPTAAKWRFGARRSVDKSNHSQAKCLNDQRSRGPRSDVMASRARSPSRRVSDPPASLSRRPIIAGSSPTDPGFVPLEHPSHSPCSRSEPASLPARCDDPSGAGSALS